MGYKVDLTGSRFGHWTVLAHDVEGSLPRRVRWLCQCDCGTMKSVLRQNLGRSSRSCGCSKLAYKAPAPTTYEPGRAAMLKLYRQYRTDAAKKGREFSLDEDSFRLLTSGRCWYCGSEPSQVKGSAPSDTTNGTYKYNGIDRQDNSQGYTSTNCVSCCRDCNYAKRSLGVDDFLALVKRIHEWRITL